eukprot:scaffold2261_cov124-Cylindrotheca_fusiformis.AAC.9
MKFLSVLSLIFSAVGGQASFPTLETPPIGANITYRTHVCENFLEYAVGVADIRDALTGLNLTVGIVDQLNDVYIRFNEDGSINEESPGIFVVILDELARRGKFSWRDSFGRVLPPSHYGVNPINGASYSWTDVLHNAVQSYDFSFAEWVHNQERRELGISFPVGWYDASTILVQSSVRDKVKFDIMAFLRPFSNEVWAMICGVFVLSGILYWVIDKIANWGTENEVNSVLYDMFLATMTFTQHHMYWDPSGHGKRIFAFSASFWSLVLASAYTANLASFLVSQGQPDEIAKNLAEVEALGIPLCVRANAAVEASLNARYPNLNLVRDPEFEVIYSKLAQGDCGLLATRPFDFDQFRNDIDLNPECSLQWVGRPDNANKGGPATLVDTKNYCTSLITHVLEIHMNEMIDNGFIDQAWQAHLRNQSDHQCSDGGKEETKDVDGQYSLTVKEVGGIFVFHAGLGLLAILVALGEKFYSRHRDAKNDIFMASKEADLQLHEQDRSSQLRASAMTHYKSSADLQRIIQEQKRTSIVGKPRNVGGGLSITRRDSHVDDDIDYGEDVLETISSLQSEMEKLQNYVVEKRNRANREPGAGA